MSKTFFLLLLLARTATAALFHCHTTGDVQRYMHEAEPGDEILLHPGTYLGQFEGWRDAHEDKPITIRSYDPTSKAVLDGLGDPLYPTAGLYITGNYWSLQDLIIENANTGVVFDNSQGGEVLNCEIRGTGEEAIHIQDGSSNVLIEGNIIHTTGVFTPGHGEAVYVGSDKSVHSPLNLEGAISHVTVRDNVIGPNVSAEAIDMREGAHDILIERNTFDASGLSGENSANSLITLKGTKGIVRYNTFNQNDNEFLARGVVVADGGQDYVIVRNTFNMEITTIPMVQANQNTEKIFVFENTRPLSGALYEGDVVSDGSVPDWYLPSESSETSPPVSSSEPRELVLLPENASSQPNVVEILGSGFDPTPTPTVFDESIAYAAHAVVVEHEVEWEARVGTFDVLVGGDVLDYLRQYGISIAPDSHSTHRGINTFDPASSRLLNVPIDCIARDDSFKVRYTGIGDTDESKEQETEHFCRWFVNDNRQEYCALVDMSPNRAVVDPASGEIVRPRIWQTCHQECEDYANCRKKEIMSIGK